MLSRTATWRKPRRQVPSTRRPGRARRRASTRCPLRCRAPSECPRRSGPVPPSAGSRERGTSARASTEPRVVTSASQAGHAPESTEPAASLPIVNVRNPEIRPPHARQSRPSHDATIQYEPLRRSRCRLPLRCLRRCRWGAHRCPCHPFDSSRRRPVVLGRIRGHRRAPSRGRRELACVIRPPATPLDKSRIRAGTDHPRHRARRGVRRRAEAQGVTLCALRTDPSRSRPRARRSYCPSLFLLAAVVLSMMPRSEFRRAQPATA